ncbi:SPC2 [Candida oxycetoniae]|uniref:Signal peptidase complex subunit 2 n=1 Tax=Candida oxycetoniae TaxID=497107 RepID=A0AAI9WX54_9ASCO|nr:SPC2 [Candida oxycetoniae]KAI3403400.1 SPC2 [Candida oxycetoniae]
MSQLKSTNLNSVKELQKATDEQLGSILQQLGFEESFMLTDLKLGLGLVTVVIAGLLFLADKRYEFKNIYGATVVSCVLYAVLNGVLLIINRKYKNVKYIGYDSKGNKLTVASTTGKYDPNYRVTVALNDKQSSQSSIPFNKYFDLIGYLNREEFTKLLAKEVNKLGKKND